MTHGKGLNPAQTTRIQAAGGTVTAHLPQIGVAIVEAGSDFGVRAAGINGIRSISPDVGIQFDQIEPLEISEADFVNPPLAAGMDNFHNLQWGHAAIDAAGAWNQDQFGAGATVAVLDSGVNCTHPDLAPNLLLDKAASFVPDETACNTSGSSHGTHVAGTIAAPMTGAGANSGVIGVAPQAKVIPVKVLSAITGSGSFAGIIQGIVHATDSGANVINMSLGVRGGMPIGGSEVAELVNATARATRHARASGVLVVASAGNDGRDLDKDSGVEICDDDDNCARYNLRAFPAQLPGVLSVAATGPEGWALDPLDTPLDRPASYSNYGLSGIDLSAPGGDFTYPGNENCSFVVTAPCWAMDMVISTTLTGWGWNAGTSMAAPHVSGVAALVYGKHGGNINPSQVESILRRSADQPGQAGKDPHFGHGRVNAAAAVGL
ncbi:S8 family serine peptidase [Lysobacter alkalisoli]|uniref:S8 family serine peptidase n=2 Tax=Marilutibacter alkalisoli TaxID=2591633 RepID=A0A514BW72_9GAMM|nr:S8 family serine peptidase [Lysobacter alkalisoli]